MEEIKTELEEMAGKVIVTLERDALKAFPGLEQQIMDIAANVVKDLMEEMLLHIANLVKGGTVTAPVQRG